MLVLLVFLLIDRVFCFSIREKLKTCLRVCIQLQLSECLNSDTSFVIVPTPQWICNEGIRI